MIEAQCPIHLGEHLFHWSLCRCLITILNDVVSAEIPNSRSRCRPLRRGLNINILYLLRLYSKAPTDYPTKRRMISLLVLEYLNARAYLSFDFTAIKIAMRDALRVAAGLFAGTSACWLLDVQAGLHVVTAERGKVLVVHLFGGTEFLILI